MTASSSFPKCYRCNNYLSIFPIMQTLSLTSICGRCKTASTEYGVRNNRQLETTIKDMPFPCRYESAGCRKKLAPLEMPIHEGSCAFRILPCPLKKICECKWTGIQDNLLYHCKETHPNFFEEDNAYNIDTSKCYERYTLFAYKRDTVLLALLRVYRKEENLKLWLSVKKCGFHSFKGGIFAVASVNKNGKTLRIKVPAFSSDNYFPKLGLEMDLVSVVEAEDGFITVKINIGENNEVTRDKLNVRDLKSEIECNVCSYEMTSQIFLCENGHSVCQNCAKRVRGCPYCRSFMTSERNHALEWLTNL